MTPNKLSLILAPIAIVTASLLSTPVQANCSANPYLGSICMTAADFCPRGYIQASGQLLSIAEYNALFSLLGKAYGGDGRTSFGLPDFRSRTAVGVGAGIGLRSVKRGELGGSEQYTLNQVNMPQHTHTHSLSVQSDLNNPITVDVKIPLSTAKGSSPSPQSGENALYTVGKNALTANPEAKIYGAAISSNSPDSYLKGEGTITQLLEVSGKIKPTGMGQSFSVRDPYLGVKYCIAVEGVYPPRN